MDQSPTPVLNDSGSSDTQSKSLNTTPTETMNCSRGSSSGGNGNDNSVSEFNRGKWYNAISLVEQMRHTTQLKKEEQLRLSALDSTGSPSLLLSKSPQAVQNELLFSKNRQS